MKQDAFDPYRKWLGIAPKDQPPNHYRLLGIDLYETDPDVISHAADQRMTHIRTFQSGPHSASSQQILNELSAARVCLMDDLRRAEYEAELKGQLRPVGFAPVAAPAEARLAPARPAANRWRDEPDDNELRGEYRNEVGGGEDRKAAAPSRAPASANRRNSVPPRGKSAARTLPLLLGIGGVGAVIIGLLAFLLSRSGGHSELETKGLAAVSPPQIITPPATKTTPQPPQPTPPPTTPPKPPQPPKAEGPPQMAAVADRSVMGGAEVEVQLTPRWPIDASRRLQFDLVSAPPGATINDQGRFRFRVPHPLP